MKIFHTSTCPICHDPLVIDWTTSNNGQHCTLYDCTKHYFYSQDTDTMEPIHATVNIPGFHLSYGANPARTYIFKFDTPKEDTYKFAFRLNYHFKINWNDIQQTSHKLKTLMVFS